MHHQHGATLVTTWTALVAGIVILVLGVWTAFVRPRLRGERDEHGWTPLLIGLFIMIETAPRVAGGSDELIAGLSLVAFVPLLALFVIVGRTYRHGRARTPERR